MAKRKAATKPASGRETKSSGAEPKVIVLAEKLGTFLGRAQNRVDGVLENEMVRQRAGQIRDGATALVEQVNRAGAAVAKTVAKARPTAKKSKAKSATATKGRSGGVVDAPGKRHRKPPPQESIDKRMGEPKGKRAGQKQFKVGKSRGRG
jgi:hypothetical protein